MRKLSWWIRLSRWIGATTVATTLRRSRINRANGARGAKGGAGGSGLGRSGLVGEVLGHPDGAGAVTVDGDADVGEGAAQDVQAVAVVGGLLVEHVLGQRHRHLGHGGGGVRHRAALADVLPGGGPADPGGGLAGADG